MTIKLVHTPVDGMERDLSQRTIYDNEGYQYVVGPNEHISSMDDGRFSPLASDATVYYGQTVNNVGAPAVGADFKPNATGRA